MAGITQPTVIALEVRNSGRLSSLNAILTVLGAGPVLSPAGENPSFYTHAGNSSAHEAWATPSWILDRLYSVFDHFDLDPCSATKDRRLTRGTGHKLEKCIAKVLYAGCTYYTRNRS
jgi:hypothetical protein